MPALKAHQMHISHVVDDAWCSGCGLHRHVTGVHRADCTAVPLPDTWCPQCKYHPAVHGHHRASCTQKGRTA